MGFEGGMIMVGIVITGGIGAVIGAMVQKELAKSAARRKRDEAFGKLTTREYHMRYNDVFAQAMKTGGKQQ